MGEHKFDGERNRKLGVEKWKKIREFGVTKSNSL